jgi:tetratricopeptide (TPR) repeat protein
MPFSAILFSVFVIFPYLNNGITSGFFLGFHLSIEIIAITSVGLIIINAKKVQFGTMDSFIVLFMCTSLFFIIYSGYEKTTTKHILSLLIPILYFYFRFVFQINKQSSYWLSACFILTGLTEAIWGLKQLYGFEQSQHNLFRITGSFFNPGPFACYVATVLPMAFFYTFKYQTCCKVKYHPRNMPIYFLGGISTLTVIASVLILPAAMSRISWIAAIGGCGFVLLFFFAENRKVKSFIASNKKRCAFVAFIALFLIVAGGFGMYHLKKDSADGRTFIWKNTIELIKQNPMGIGIGNFSGSYGHIQAAYFDAGYGTDDEKRVAGNPEYAFNEFLQICAEQGIIVFLLFFGIIGYSLYLGIKRRKIAPTASLIALLIAASASYPFSVLPFLIVLVFLLAFINTGEKGLTIPKPVTIAFAFCGLMIVSLCLYNHYPTYNAYKKWNNIKMSYNFGNHKNAANEYRSIYPLLSDQIQFLFEYAQCLSKSELYEESNGVLKKAIKISCDPMLYNIMGKNFHALKQYDKAEQCFIKSSHIVPSRLYPYYLMALMYMDTGEAEKAKKNARIVLTKEPKVQSTAVREMRHKMKEILDEN